MNIFTAHHNVSRSASRQDEDVILVVDSTVREGEEPYPPPLFNKMRRRISFSVGTCLTLPFQSTGIHFLKKEIRRKEEKQMQSLRRKRAAGKVVYSTTSTT